MYLGGADSTSGTPINAVFAIAVGGGAPTLTEWEAPSGDTRFTGEVTGLALTPNGKELFASNNTTTSSQLPPPPTTSAGTGPTIIFRPTFICFICLTTTTGVIIQTPRVVGGRSPAVAAPCTTTAPGAYPPPRQYALNAVAFGFTLPLPATATVPPVVVPLALPFGSSRTVHHA